jgi:hypothetical protein
VTAVVDPAGVGDPDDGAGSGHPPSLPESREGIPEVLQHGAGVDRIHARVAKRMLPGVAQAASNDRFASPMA